MCIILWQQQSAPAKKNKCMDEKPANKTINISKSETLFFNSRLFLIFYYPVTHHFLGWLFIVLSLTEIK
jgi:hypothetical protein